MSTGFLLGGATGLYEYNGGLVGLPLGADASVCPCCGPCCPNDVDVEVSGFPSSLTMVWVEQLSGVGYLLWTRSVSGLDVYNRTVNLSVTNCVPDQLDLGPFSSPSLGDITVSDVTQSGAFATPCGGPWGPPGPPLVWTYPAGMTIDGTSVVARLPHYFRTGIAGSSGYFLAGGVGTNLCQDKTETFSSDLLSIYQFQKNSIFNPLIEFCQGQIVSFSASWTFN